MPGSHQSTPPLDLTRFSEDTRRRLYDHLRQMHFFCPGRDSAESDLLPYSAEEAGLSILYVSVAGSRSGRALKSRATGRRRTVSRFSASRLPTEPARGSLSMSAEPWRMGHSLYILRVVQGFSRAALEEAAGLEPGKVRSFEDGAEEPDADAVSRIIAAMGYTRVALSDARYYYEAIQADTREWQRRGAP